jgi:hypothetical protein
VSVYSMCLYEMTRISFVLTRVWSLFRYAASGVKFLKYINNSYEINFIKILVKKK